MSTVTTSYLAQLDLLAADQRFPLVRRWIDTEPIPFFKELREARPILETPVCTLVTRFDDVIEVLGMPRIFTAALYLPKMSNGLYLMAHDDDALHTREKTLMQALLNRDDLPQVRAMVAEIAKGLLDAAGGRLEAVNDYCRMVPATLVERYFGLTGANKRDTHLLNVNVNRDFRPDLTTDIRVAVIGDACPRCGSALGLTPGIEVGHVFKLGTRYSAKMNCSYLDEKGQLHPMVMGCYGIGVNRILAAAVENHHDEAGILWPAELAPYQVEIVSLDHKKMQIVETAHDLHDSLTKAGLEVLWDDRDAAPGVKFTDADLIGLPVRVTVGKKTLEAGTVDIRTRKNKDQKSVTLEQVVEMVKHELAEYRL